MVKEGGNCLFILVGSGGSFYIGYGGYILLKECEGNSNRSWLRDKWEYRVEEKLVEICMAWWLVAVLIRIRF